MLSLSGACGTVACCADCAAFGPSADRPRPGLVGVVCMHVRRCASARETS
jgi:hypothetical protein